MIDSVSRELKRVQNARKKEGKAPRPPLKASFSEQKPIGSLLRSLAEQVPQVRSNKWCNRTFALICLSLDKRITTRSKDATSNKGQSLLVTRSYL